MGYRKNKLFIRSHIMEMGWDITKFYYWAYAQGAKNTFCEKKISKWAKAFRNNSIVPVHHRPNSPHSSLRSRILIYILQYTKWKFGPKSVRVGSCGVKKCGVMTPVTLASATSLVESGLVSVNLKGPWKSRRIYPKYMPKCSVGFTDHVCNFFTQKY